mmetsp:Transcript_12516/g.33195  ORF Transcript_12516/g.33195 Transcript_12516/m.33195 type:complete len:124 (+) Transcript_12516:29-400(+)
MVTPHGAGLVNLLWMPAAAHVLEIIPFPFHSARDVNMYEVQAMRLLLKYFKYYNSDRSWFDEHNPEFKSEDAWRCTGRCIKMAKRAQFRLIIEGKQGVRTVLEEALQSWTSTCVGLRDRVKGA